MTNRPLLLNVGQYDLIKVKMDSWSQIIYSVHAA